MTRDFLVAISLAAVALTSRAEIISDDGGCVAARAEGSPARMESCNESKAQAFNYINGSLQNGLGMCLDVEGSRTADGTRVVSWVCHGGINQRWHLRKGMLVGLGGKCLDVKDGNINSGATLIVWECHGGTNQLWTVR